MAYFHLAFGGVSVALVARIVLGEHLTAMPWVGFSAAGSRDQADHLAPLTAVSDPHVSPPAALY